MSLREQHVREFTRACVRAGLLSREELHAEVAADLPDQGGDPDSLARAWLDGAREELRRDQSEWPRPTDYDRLQSAFGELEVADVVVLQGCEDHWAAKAALEARAGEGRRPRGIAWFTPPDVWHAVDEGRIEVAAHWHRRDLP